MKKTIITLIVTIISMVAILGAGFGINCLIQREKEAKWESQREARLKEVNEYYESVQSAISEVSQLSPEEIAAYIEENTDKDEDDFLYDEENYTDPWLSEDGSYSWNTSDSEEDETFLNQGVEEGLNPEEIENWGETVSGSSLDEADANTEGDAVSDGSAIYSREGDDVSENKKNSSTGDGDLWESGTSRENVDRVAELGKKAVLENTGSESSVSENSISEDLISGSSVSENSVSGNSVSGNSVSGNSVSGNSVSGNSVSSNDLSGGHHQDGSTDPTLKERQALRTSYEETQMWIEADEKVLAQNTFDFSNKKIVCLGDSITAASNLIDKEGYEQYTYPNRLKEILGAESVLNLGIGGSSLGRYWDQAFCERYQEIPEDTDIIIIMGGDNDGYCLHEDMVGDINTREYRTLYGDTDELMKGLKEHYPNADIFIMTEMPNLLHDVLRKERPELLPQTVVINCLKELTAEYGFYMIDNYNSNFFDSHDADIVSDYIPDSVHPNEKGYEVFAKHVAAEMIRIYEKQNPSQTEDLSKEEAKTVSENSLEDSKEDSVSENDADISESKTKTAIFDRDDEDAAKASMSSSDSSAENSESDNKSADSKSGDSKSGDSKSGDSKSGDSKSGDSKSEDTKPEDSKSENSKTVIFGRE